jgi:hypothetical protein
MGPERNCNVTDDMTANMSDHIVRGFGEMKEVC